MLFRCGLRMRPQEMMQDVQEGLDMGAVVARLRAANVIDNHAADFLRARILFQKILTVGNRRHFGKMFVLGNGKNLFLGQIAETEAVFHGDHCKSEAQSGLKMQFPVSICDCPPIPSP